MSRDYEEFTAAFRAHGRSRLEVGPRADKLGEKREE